jgi:glycyl-tRNA synthetase beta chain
MPELLLELFSEEIPARMQARAAEDLARLMAERLKAEGLEAKSVRSFAGPRRLSVVMEDLPVRQPDRREEKKGPRVDAPAQAVDGFLRSVGLTRQQVETRKDPKGDYLFAVMERRGAPAVEIVARIVPEIVSNFPWPKSMRRGEGELRWVRPLHFVLCLFGGKVVPFEIDDIKSGGETRGHRFHAPENFSVKDFADYEKQLRKAHVILDGAERRRIIVESAQALAKEAGYALVEDDALLSENAGLVEWPVVLMGKIDDTFVAPIDIDGGRHPASGGGLPHEVLVTAMRTHQKYFSLRDPKTGLLAPRFILVANLEAKDGGAAIVAGNERVLRARLSDAKFFWGQDRKKKLADRIDALQSIVFHAKLGTMREKAERVAVLARELAPVVGADAEEALRAARLAKADLTTQMVGEFPELQGVMGRYYALHDGELLAVAEAIEEHYKPLGPSDECPSQPVSVSVALADKLDTLVRFWMIDERPTGSKDPFALRRAALGVIRLVLENDLRIPLEAPIRRAGILAMNVDVGTSGGLTIVEVMKDLLVFFADRLKVALREKGVRHDLIDAVFALGGEDDLVRLMMRVEALQKFLITDDGANLLVGYRRAANILRIEEKNDKTSYTGHPDPELIARAGLPEEKALAVAIAEVKELVEAELERERFDGAMSAMAKLRLPVDRFFDKVTVNTNDAGLRKNRLLLLSQIRDTLHKVADFSKIEG